MRKPVVLAALVVALAAASCGVGSDDPPAASHSGLITASEFVVGTNRFPFALVSVDGVAIGDGQPGPVCKEAQKIV